MSDTPQGDGWWQTSDGKWHPPDYDPTVPEAQAPSPSATPPPWSPSGTQTPPPAPSEPTAEWGDQWTESAPAAPFEAPAQDPLPDAPLFGDQSGTIGQAEVGQPESGFQDAGVQGQGPPDPTTGADGDAPFTTNRPGEFGLPSEAPRAHEPKVVRPAPVAVSGGEGESSGGMSPAVKWSVVAAVALLAIFAGWYFLLRDGGDDTAVTSEAPEPTVAGDTTVATPEDAEVAESTAPLPPKPTIAAGERLPVLEFNGTGSSVVAIDPPGPRVATIEYTGTGPLKVTGKDANDGDVATYVSTEGPYSGSVAVDFSDDQDSRSLAIEADGPWTIRMEPVENLDAIPGAFTGSGDNVVLYSGAVGPVTVSHSGSGAIKVNTFEIKTRDIATIVDETGPFDGSVELRGPAFVWIEADGDWSITPG